MIGPSPIKIVPCEKMVSLHGLINSTVMITDSKPSVTPSCVGIKLIITESCPGRKMIVSGKKLKSVPSTASPVMV